MKKTDLRLGNYINYCNDNRLSIVSNLGHFFRTENTEGITNGSDSLDDYEPIIITAEWLIKLGFGEVKEIHNNVFSGKIKLKPFMKTDYFEVFVGSVSLTFIKNVHELQNLYLALTGIELMIKE